MEDNERKIAEFLSEIEKEEKIFYKKQLEENKRIPKYELTSINQLIIEYLTTLTDENSNHERYINVYANKFSSDVIHTMIQDLSVLYEIKEKLKKEV